MEDIQPYLDYFQNHPQLAVVIVFLIAFGEALLIIGLFVPSTVVLVGAGILVGSGHLSFWPVFLATVVGAFIGDQLSYWAGRIYGDRLRNMWPLSRYPQLVAKGEDYVRRHGGKSIAIGRFVPGVKAVVPGIVGMLGMNQMFFLIVNFLSSIVWGAMHVFPGILAGQGLALAGELSGRLAIVLVELLIILAVAGWLIRVVAAALSPYLDHALEHLSRSLRHRSSASLRRLGRALSPGNPRAMLVVSLFILMVMALGAFIVVMTGVVDNSSLVQADISVMTVMSNLRNAPADQLFIPITMMGDAVVLVPVMVAIVGWLLWMRAWRAATLTALTFIFGKIIATLMKLEVHRVRPNQIYHGLEAYSFPSGHTTSSALTFGALAMLVTYAMNRWTRSLAYVFFGLLVIAIAYTRVYLGVHWMSDTIGGLLYSLAVIAAFGLALEAVPKRRIQPHKLTAIALLVFLSAWVFNLTTSLSRQEVFYAPKTNIEMVSLSDWQTNLWRQLPSHRVDFAGKQEEAFTLQWTGDLFRLRLDMEQLGWQFSPKWSWHNAFAYLDPSQALSKLAPRPAMHYGMLADLTMVQPIAEDAKERMVLRAYRTELRTGANNVLYPVYLISITDETLSKKLATYVVPILSPLRPEQNESLRHELEEQGHMLFTRPSSQPPILAIEK